MIHAIAFVDDMAREQSRERTRDALRRKAERGHVAGGLLYGYRNVRGDGHVTRVIVPEEADVIRRIFREIAAGAGYLAVAQTFNREGLPGPCQRPWAASSIRAMVFNPLYRGEIVWGRTRRVDQGGTKRKVDVTDKSAWVTVPAPDCRIIEQTAAVVDDVAVTAELRARCAEWRALLTENPAQAQAILRRLVPERLTLERKPSGLWLTGMATFGPLMARVARCAKEWCPRGDSNTRPTV